MGFHHRVALTLSLAALASAALAQDLIEGTSRFDADGDGTIDEIAVGDYDGDGVLEITDDIGAALVELCAPLDGSMDCSDQGLCSLQGTAKRADVDGDGTLEEWCGELRIRPGVYGATGDGDDDGIPDFGLRIPWRGFAVRGHGAQLDISTVSCETLLRDGGSGTNHGIFSSLLPAQDALDNDRDGATDEPDENDCAWCGPLLFEGLTIVGYGARPDLDADAMMPPWGQRAYRGPADPAETCTDNFQPATFYSGFAISQPHRVTMRDIRIFNMDRAGIILTGAAAIAIENVEIDGAGEHCISLSRSGNVTLSGATLRNCGKMAGDQDRDGTADLIPVDRDNDGTPEATRYANRGSGIVWFEGTSDFGRTDQQVNVALRDISIVDSFAGIQGEDDGDGSASRQALIENLYCDRLMSRCIAFRPGAGGGEGQRSITIRDVVNVDSSWDGESGTLGGGITVRTSGGSDIGKIRYIELDNILIENIDAQSSNGTGLNNASWLSLNASDVRLRGVRIIDSAGRFDKVAGELLSAGRIDRLRIDQSEFVWGSPDARAIAAIGIADVESASDDPTELSVTDSVFVNNAGSLNRALHALQANSPTANLDKLVFSGNSLFERAYDGTGSGGTYGEAVRIENVDHTTISGNYIETSQNESAAIWLYRDYAQAFVTGNDLNAAGDGSRGIRLDGAGTVFATGNLLSGDAGYIQVRSADVSVYALGNMGRPGDAGRSLADKYDVGNAQDAYVADIGPGGASWDLDGDGVAEFGILPGGPDRDGDGTVEVGTVSFDFVLRDADLEPGGNASMSCGAESITHCALPRAGELVAMSCALSGDTTKGDVKFNVRWRDAIGGQTPTGLTLSYDFTNGAFDSVQETECHSECRWSGPGTINVRAYDSDDEDYAGSGDAQCQVIVEVHEW